MMLNAGIRARKLKRPLAVNLRSSDNLRLYSQVLSAGLSQPAVDKELRDFTDISCFQLNNHKHDGSMDVINERCDKFKYFIAFGQEPNIDWESGQINGLNPNHKLLYVQGTGKLKPRSYIYTSGNLNIWPVTHCVQGTL